MPLTYIGRRISGNKLVHSFKGEGQTVHFPKAKASNFIGARIGHIYDVGEKLSTRVIWKDIEVGQVSDDKKVDLQVAEAADLALWSQRKVKPREELEDIILQLRNARDRLTPQARGGFDSWVLQKLRGG